MKKFFLAIALLVFSVQLTAQTDSLQSSATFSNRNNFYPGKLSTNLQMGSQFSSFSGNGNAFSSYVMPDFSYGLTSRISLFAGFGIINTQYNGFSPFYFSEEKTDGNFTSGIIYGGGRYLLNNRVTITGSAYKMFDIMGQYPASPYSNSRNPQGINFNVDYKITEGFHIQAGFGYHENVSPYYYNDGSIFRNDPFRQPFSPFPSR